jgi:ubiquinone/menaquinone biosynthesis C-methylase UbiE
MDIEQSYYSVSRFFDIWVRVMELQTRRMELEDSVHGDSKILIVSPPTDTGIPLIAKANPDARITLLCFSERLKRIAEAYIQRHEIGPLRIQVAPFFRLPFADGEFGTVYANCFFDFCQEKDFAMILDEIWRVLMMNGSLFSVYTDYPGNFLAHGWVCACRQFTFLSQGCHPACIGSSLSRCGFLIRRDRLAGRLGFPLRYTFAEKLAGQ